MAQVLTTPKNYVSGSSADVLNEIHHNDVNIAIYNRGVNQLRTEVDELLTEKVALRFSGTVEEIINGLSETIDGKRFGQLLNDIEQLLHLFGQVSQADSFKVFLGTVNTNMCRKFPTDINDLRMLCTYSGPGTMWLKEENINRSALSSSSSQEEDIVIDENDIQQVATGSVVILKGAIYPKDESKAIVHRSPTIEETGESRLLLRINTNAFLH